MTNLADEDGDLSKVQCAVAAGVNLLELLPHERYLLDRVVRPMRGRAAELSRSEALHPSRRGRVCAQQQAIRGRLSWHH